jgi:putative addiction module killer protein
VELRYYQTWIGKQPFADWLEALSDRQARARIDARLTRMVVGNAGDVAPVGEGVMEMRIDWGPGYRVYFARVGQAIVLLLCGGDKRSQQKDIERAKTYLEDFKARSARKKRGA